MLKSSLGFTVASFIDKNCKRFVQCFDVPAIGMYVTTNEGFVERETVFIFSSQCLAVLLPLLQMTA